MKILVIDDSNIHLAAAMAQLGKEHEVSTVSYADGALKLLGCGYGHGEDRSNQHGFDVVLCDLLMDSPGRACREQTMMDTGMYLAITAARNGAKFVGLLTDSSHHSHPAADCLDSIQRDEIWPDVFPIDGAKVCFSNNRNWVGKFDPNDLSKPLKYEEYSKRTDTVRAKNWSALLERLLTE